MRKYIVIGGVLVFLLALLFAASYFMTRVGSQVASAPADANMSADFDYAVENAVDADVNAMATEQGSTDVGDVTAVIHCDVLNDRTTAAQCDYFKEIRAKLATGEAALDIPDPIVRGETATVSFVVTRDPASSPVGDLLGSRLIRATR